MNNEFGEEGEGLVEEGSDGMMKYGLVGLDANE